MTTRPGIKLIYLNENARWDVEISDSYKIVRKNHLNKINAAGKFGEKS